MSTRVCKRCGNIFEVESKRKKTKRGNYCHLCKYYKKIYNPKKIEDEN